MVGPVIPLNTVDNKTFSVHTYVHLLSVRIKLEEVDLGESLVEVSDLI